MSRKLSRSSIAKKAWKTRKANELALKTKANDPILKAVDEGALKIGDTLRIRLPKDYLMMTTVRSIADEMDDALDNLETRLRATTKRINSIMKV